MLPQPTPTDEFNRNVFINCPFDAEYQELLRPLVFTLIACGFVPRVALERFDSGEIRLSKILALLQSSRFSIHDLSRVKSARRGEYYRLNMPFELGLDLGCRLFHPHLQAKQILVLEGERFAYQKALSDLAGADTKCHENNPEELVFEVRTWFSEIGIRNLMTGTQLWDEHNEFSTAFFVKRLEEGYQPKDIDRMLLPEYLDFVSEWVQTRNVGGKIEDS